MHLKSSTILFGLGLIPAVLSANEQQATLKEKAAGWLDKAKAYVSSAAPSIPNPIDAGAAKVAEYKVEKINIRNYERKLGPKPDGEEEWMVYIHGGNKTCHGACGKADLAWNESIPLLAALEPFSGSTLKFGQLDCEIEEVLCTAWAAAVPSIFHFIFPQYQPSVLGAARPASPLHDMYLNLSSVAVKDIVSIPRASESRYLTVDEYTGAFHPVDGSLRQYGLLNAVGYAVWGFSSTPSWLFMILISFVSRQMMARKASQRMAAPTNNPDAIGRPAGAGAGAAAPAPAGGAAGAGAGGSGSGASPAGGKGSAKKRK